MIRSLLKGVACLLAFCAIAAAAWFAVFWWVSESQVGVRP